ncbi:MAG: nuclear transport factor 2 family protein, partial [bacterium]|nr:nuclear transport factor 2 family protein [bacterium]
MIRVFSLLLIIFFAGCTPVVDLAEEKALVNSVLEKYDTASTNEDSESFFSIFSEAEKLSGFGLAKNENWTNRSDFVKDMKVMFDIAADIRASSKNRVIAVHESGTIAYFNEILDISFTVQGNELQR